jgi:M6 family metalloprotease-like protein
MTSLTEDIMKHILIVIAFFSTLVSSAAFANPWLGKQRALVILMNWADTKSTHTQEEMEDTFFNMQGPSLRKFFQENSSGKFDITGAVINWKDSNNSWNTDWGCDPTMIAKIAWKEFAKDVSVEDYDANSDGKIDHLFVVHSGRMLEDRVGPQCMFTDIAPAENTVVFQAEGVGPIGNAIPIGFYLHEAGHKLFGFPDLYADHYHGKYGIGMWGMMGLGCWGTSNETPVESLFRLPAHFEPLSKEQMGWAEPKIISKNTKRIQLRPVELTGDIVKIPLPDDQSYYLEYRTHNGFSKGHHGEGLLIWKDYELIQADGRDDLNHGNDLGRRPLPPNNENFGDDSDPFPGSMNVTQYKDETNGVLLENISLRDGVVEFDVVINKVAKPSHKPARPRFNGVERL